MPIRARLALAFAVVTLALVCIGGTLFARSFRSGLENSLSPGLRSQADAFAQQVQDLGADAAVETVNADPSRGRDIVEQVLARDGRVLAATREAGRTSVVGRETVVEAARFPVFANTEVGAEREPYRLLAVPVVGHSGTVVAVVATSLEATDEAAGRVHEALLIGGASAVFLAAVGGWFLAGAALRPVERMRRQAAAISEHDADSRLEVPRTRDEIAALATTMNALLTRLHDASRQQRDFVADAGHELRTPLSVLRIELELANRPLRTEVELRDALHHASGSVDNLARLADDLLLLARADETVETRFESVQLGALVEASVDMMRDRAAAAEVTFVVHGSKHLEVLGVPSLLRRALDNLLENALRYSPLGSTIAVTVRAADDDVNIEVHDEGPGFPPSFLPDAFERFRRADDARSRTDGGTGLGLAIVRAVAEVHGGTATATNDAAGGALVTLTVSRSM
jgi:hypothetical protein